MIPNSSDRLSAIILCGGRSSRMGRPKHELIFGAETALQRVARIVSSVCGEIVIVGATELQMPQLPKQAVAICDVQTYPGPLTALVQGLKTLSTATSATVLVGCDMPLISGPFLQKLAEELQVMDDIVAVEHDACPQPLAAIYRPRVLQNAECLLEQGTRSLQALLQVSRTRLIAAEVMREVDPALDSLKNMNSEKDYQSLLRRFNERLIR